jgi:hypothetical protein
MAVTASPGDLLVPTGSGPVTTRRQLPTTLRDTQGALLDTQDQRCDSSIQVSDAYEQPAKFPTESYSGQYTISDIAEPTIHDIMVYVKSHPHRLSEKVSELIPLSTRLRASGGVRVGVSRTTTRRQPMSPRRAASRNGSLRVVGEVLGGG